MEMFIEQLRSTLHLLFVALTTGTSATVWTINNSGNNFVPTLITINAGDTVRFQISAAHDAREVSQATWSGNGNTPLPGGFQTPDGGGFIYPAQLGVGTHYYVCTPHADQGMKGRIVVQDITTSSAGGRVEGTLSAGPNPAVDLLQVTIPEQLGGALYQVFDDSGRVVRSGTVVAPMTLVQLSDMRDGAYLLRITGTEARTIRIVKGSP